MNCKNCKADCASRGYDCEKDCQGHIPKTNADRIRSKTDEELADLLSGENIYPWCLKEPCPEECRECILSWLKEEVKDDV